MARDAPLAVLNEVRNGAIGALRVVEMECTGWDIINAGIHWIQYFIMLALPQQVDRVLTACDSQHVRTGTACRWRPRQLRW